MDFCLHGIYIYYICRGFSQSFKQVSTGHHSPFNTFLNYPFTLKKNLMASLPNKGRIQKTTYPSCVRMCHVTDHVVCSHWMVHQPRWCVWPSEAIYQYTSLGWWAICNDCNSGTNILHLVTLFCFKFRPNYCTLFIFTMSRLTCNVCYFYFLHFIYAMLCMHMCMVWLFQGMTPQRVSTGRRYTVLIGNENQMKNC